MCVCGGGGGVVSDFSEGVVIVNVAYSGKIFAGGKPLLFFVSQHILQNKLRESYVCTRIATHAKWPKLAKIIY